MIVSKTDTEVSHSIYVTRDQLVKRLRSAIQNLDPQKANEKSRHDYMHNYSRRIIQHVNKVQDKGQMKEKGAHTGEVRVSSLYHKRAKKTNPLLSWEMFHKVYSTTINTK